MTPFFIEGKQNWSRSLTKPWSYVYGRLLLRNFTKSVDIRLEPNSSQYLQPFAHALRPRIHRPIRRRRLSTLQCPRLYHSACHRSL